MPTFDYKCDKCGASFEFCTNDSVPKSMRPPEDLKCPDCKEGSLQKQFSAEGQSFDIVGYCYENVYGKKNWKAKKTLNQQMDVLEGKADPY